MMNRKLGSSLRCSFEILKEDIVMLEWKEIKGIQQKLNHYGNKCAGVLLPELDREVLFCRPHYVNDGKDVPNIIVVDYNDVTAKIGELKTKGFERITVFKYIKPCSYMYDWSYVKEHTVDAVMS